MQIGVFRPISHFISKTVQDMVILIMKANRNLYQVYRMLPFSVTSDHFKVTILFDVK